MRRGQSKIKQLALIVLSGALASCASIPWNSYVEPADFMKDFGYKPLKECTDLPDALQLYSGGFRSNKKITEIEIGSSLKYRQSQFVPKEGKTIELPTSKATSLTVATARGLLQETSETMSYVPIHELQKINKSETITVCADGPQYFAIIRVNGKVKSGKLESCGYPQTYELVCEIETGAKCKK